MGSPWPVPASLPSAYPDTGSVAPCGAACSGADPPQGRHAARTRRTLSSHAQSPGAAAPGSEFPLGDILQNLDVQLLVRHQALQPGVLLLQIHKPLHRVRVYRPVLGPPPVQRHLGHPQRPRHLGKRRALGQGLVSLPELRDHLLGSVTLPVRKLHRRLLSAPWAAKVFHKGWICSAHSRQSAHSGFQSPRVNLQI